MAKAIDFIVRREFDYAAVEYANGKPLEEILGVILSRTRTERSFTTPIVRPSPISTRCPDVVDVYKRDLDVTRYNVPFLLYPYVALYTTRGCPAQCTFCLWPQTLSGHPWRKRSSDAVAAEMKKAKDLLAIGEGILLRRRHLQHSESAHHRALRKAEAARR